MRTITATELRQKLGEMLDAASVGEKILIERDHKPLAYLISFEEGQRMAAGDEKKIKRQLQAIDDMVAFGKEWRRNHPPQPGDLSAAEWIRWDRDHRDDEKWERSFGPEARAEREARQRQAEDEH